MIFYDKVLKGKLITYCGNLPSYIMASSLRYYGFNEQYNADIHYLEKLHEYPILDLEL